MDKHRTRLLAILTAVVLVCCLVAAPAAAQPAGDPVEPGAGGWHTWLLASGDEMRLPPPPSVADTQSELAVVQAFADSRDGAMLDRIGYWDAGAPSYRWTQRAVKWAQDHGMGAPRAGRLLALMNIGIYDATIAAWDSKYAYNRARPSDGLPSLAAVASPASASYPDERAVAAGAAQAVLSYVFPNDADTFAAWANEASTSRIEAGVAYPSDATAGLLLGQQVGDRAVARGRADGSDAVWTGSVPTEPGKWKGTNPVEPLLGTWTPWALKSGSQFRPGPPPAVDSAEMAKELAEVRDYPRTNLTNLTASFWEYYGGRGAFEFWNDQASRTIFDYHLDTNPPAAARVYALTDAAFADAFIACWDAKYTYWTPRPNMVDPSVKTVFVTPNHPGYPSAHSCVSGAVGSTLGRLFPREAGYFNGLAEQAGEARIMGGIHFHVDCEVGLTLGRQVAGVVWERAALTTSQ